MMYTPAVLPEVRASGVRYEPRQRTARVDVEPGGEPSVREAGTLLLARDGMIVGVDVSPTSPKRAVVMIGAHDAVSVMRQVTLLVARDGSGRVTSLVVQDVAPPR